jgi:hypothetical protein
VPEADGIVLECSRQRGLALVPDLVGGAVVDRGRGVEGDARVAVDVVVVLEELGTEGPCVLDGAEPVGERRAVLQGLEGRFRERVVVALTG